MTRLLPLVLLAGCYGSQLHEYGDDLRRHSHTIQELCPHATTNAKKSSACHALLAAYAAAWDAYTGLRQCSEAAHAVPEAISRLDTLLRGGSERVPEASP